MSPFVIHSGWALWLGSVRTMMNSPIIQEVALPRSGAVLHRVNGPLHPEYLHGLTPNVQLLQTQLTLNTDR